MLYGVTDKVTTNSQKSQFLLITKKIIKPATDIKIVMYGVEILPADEAKFLGLRFDGKLVFKSHFAKMEARANKRLNVLKALSNWNIN